MAKNENPPADERPQAEQGVGEGTAAPEAEGDKKGLHDGNPRRKIVGDYPERPYSEAVTKEHLEVLRAAGQEPTD
jgi:hypothetical protein